MCFVLKPLPAAPCASLCSASISLFSPFCCRVPAVKLGQTVHYQIASVMHWPATSIGGKRRAAAEKTKRNIGAAMNAFLLVPTAAVSSSSH